MARSLKIDAVKGVGILLVVIYHSIGKNIPDALTDFDNGLFNMIACFFMQMFMIVSGYLIYNKVKNWNDVKPRITRWIIPLFAFLIIYWLAGQFIPQLAKVEPLPLSTYLSYELATGFTGLVTWYLWCLMLCYLLVHIVERFKINRTLTIVVVVVAVNIIPTDLLGLLYLKWYSLFFFAGYLLKHYEAKLARWNKLVYISLILFPLFGYLTNWMIDWQNIDYGYIGTAAIVPALMNGQALLILIMTWMALLGSAFVYSLVKLVKLRWLLNALSYLGKRSVGIYLLHVLFVGITQNAALSSITALAISLTLYELLSRIRVTKKYLFGN